MRSALFFTFLAFLLLVGIFLAGGVFIMATSDCEEKSAEVKQFVEKANQVSSGKYIVSLDECYQEANILNHSDRVDSVLFHNLLVDINRIENRSYHLNIRDKDSKLLYVEYRVVSLEDTSYIRIDHYEY